MNTENKTFLGFNCWIDKKEKMRQKRFHNTKNDKNMPEGPLVLILCIHCELLQLQHSFNPLEMYGDNYGYRSSLNQSMVKHLESKVASLENLCRLQNGDIVIDIGSNDATTLKCYRNNLITRIGIDPVGKKFHNYLVLSSKGSVHIPCYTPNEARLKHLAQSGLGPLFGSTAPE